MPPKTPQADAARLNKIVADAQRNRELREQDYRAQALKLYPWICGRCQREFTRENLQELTVHHRDHNHDNNPANGSNWELLCLYCHDNEHARYLDQHTPGAAAPAAKAEPASKHNPFADLKSLLEKKS